VRRHALAGRRLLGRRRQVFTQQLTQVHLLGIRQGGEALALAAEQLPLEPIELPLELGHLAPQHHHLGGVGWHGVRGGAVHGHIVMDRDLHAFCGITR
jgi:hypothetical protein